MDEMLREKPRLHQVHDNVDLSNDVYEKTGNHDYVIEDAVQVIPDEFDMEDSTIVRIALPDGRVELFVADPSGSVDLDVDLRDYLERRADVYLDLAEKISAFLNRWAPADCRL